MTTFWDYVFMISLTGVAFMLYVCLFIAGCLVADILNIKRDSRLPEESWWQWHLYGWWDKHGGPWMWQTYPFKPRRYWVLSIAPGQWPRKYGVTYVLSRARFLRDRYKVTDPHVQIKQDAGDGIFGLMDSCAHWSTIN